MNLSQIIKDTCKRLNITMSELARRTEQSPQNLLMKLKRGSISYDEFCLYMEKLNTAVKLNMVLPTAGGFPIQKDERGLEQLAQLNARCKVFDDRLNRQKRICTDIRTALYNTIGCTDMALGCIGDVQRETELLKKAQAGAKQFCDIAALEAAALEPARPAKKNRTKA